MNAAGTIALKCYNNEETEKGDTDEM